MVKSFLTKIVTANDLLTGEVIYQTDNNSWTKHLIKAEILEQAILANERLETAKLQEFKVVGAYLIDVSLSTLGPAPCHFRERFRSKGPSNYFHGKQAS
jgi:uncharacterized protein YjbI with pentapeptide repeats